MEVATKEGNLSARTEGGSVAGGNQLAAVIRALQRLGQARALRIAAVVVLFSAAAVREATVVSAFSSDDIWWHLRTGVWVLQNHAVPRTGLFSQFPNARWVAFSWPYDALLSAAYTVLGLRAVPLLLMLFKVALAGLIFLLAGGWRHRFWSSLLLSVAAQFAFVFVQPLPVVFSICFFGLVIYLLFECRRRNELAPLFWLPLLFWLWANLDAQVVLGLLLLATFVLAEATERILLAVGILRCNSRRIPLVSLLAVAAAGVGATFITPYSTDLFSSAVRSGYSDALVENFGNMMARDFRRPEHFLYLLLFVAACLGLGRQRSRDIFKMLLLIFWSLLAFRVQRDSWTVLLPSIAILGDAIGAGDDRLKRIGPWKERIFIPAIVVVVLVVSFFRLPSNQVLQVRLGRVLPAQACAYIKSNQLPGPIFNAYEWGGYLIWNLPEYPVSLDERINLYGNKASKAYFDVVMGKQRMEALPNFARAQTILLPVNFSMTKALTTLPVLRAQFREVYRDDIAVVLVRRAET